MKRERTAFSSILSTELKRRSLLKGMLAAGTIFAVPTFTRASVTPEYKGVSPSKSNQHEVEEGHDVNVLLRWGDSLFETAQPFDPLSQSQQSQEQQFGYNNDYVAFLPLPLGSKNSQHGLLCVNHENTLESLMFPPSSTLSGEEKATIQLAAQGHSIVEIMQSAGKWEVVFGRYNRRISGASTPIDISGPARGSTRLATLADPSATRVIGTFANCAGGVTPWGTVLIAEENFDGYFGGNPNGTPEEGNHRSMGITGKTPYYPVYSKYLERFQIEKNPNEPNRFGWIIEIDPYTPGSVPVKRTALGRFKHEAANTVLSADGRLVVYSGDDEVFQCIYKFVSKDKVDLENRNNNAHLLDEGTLYVAKFDAPNRLEWLPLVYGVEPLISKNGFNSQADVLIEARRAAELVGGTPMDRPEDIEVNPLNGIVYAVMTNNTKRKNPSPANPRSKNTHGHMIEMIAPLSGDARDHAATQFTWDIFFVAGEGDLKNTLSCPDNIAFDSKGRMWVATDGQPAALSYNDSAYVMATEGKNKAIPRRFFNAPSGSEVCGPALTPDGTTLFLAIQHPAEGSNFLNPNHRWPDENTSLPPRPSIVAITHKNGNIVG